MRRLYYPELLCIIFTALCCRDKIYVADEYLGDKLSSDSSGEQGISTGSEVETDMDSEPPASMEDTDSTVDCEAPAEFSWTSSAPLILPPNDDVFIKDPTAVLYGDKWLVFATSIVNVNNTNEISMVYLTFTDWKQAESAEQIPVSSNVNLAGYKAAPQLFYFAPRDLWYLVYQTQEPAYSTTRDPTDILSWSASTRFMPMPLILTENDKYGIDYWVICDDTDCYMFFSALDGVLYRARTTKEAFPEGFEGTTKIVMRDESNTNKIYDACNVYKLAGTDQYLLLVSAIGEARFFQSWISDRLDGTWTPLAITESDAFASIKNVTDADWAKWGISHGEMLRTNPDETMTIDPCNMQYLFSGLKQSEENPGNEYYCLGLLTSAE
jgi:hypothetical protein